MFSCNHCDSFMCNYVVSPSYEISSETNERKTEQFIYIEIILLDFLFQKCMLKINTFNWHWLLYTIVLRLILVKNCFSKYFYIFLTCFSLKYYPLLLSTMNHAWYFDVWYMKCKFLNERYVIFFVKKTNLLIN